MARKKIPSPVRKNELNKILYGILDNGSGYKKDLFIRLRNVFMVYFAYCLGLRPGECFRAKIEHINLEKQEMYIPASHNKQRQSDLLFFPDFLIPQLEAYLKERNKRFPESEWMFPTRSIDRGDAKGRMERSQFGKIFRDAIKKAGLYQVSYIDAQGLKRANLNVYSLRHGFGTRCYEKTKDLKQTSILMRHKDCSMRSTLMYVHLSEDKERKRLINEVYNEGVRLETFK